MRIRRLIVPLGLAALMGLASAQAARANLLVQIDKSTQRMAVTLDGKQLYDWPVSTGRPGYDTPNGSFKPFRKDINHHSDEYDAAPMPYSIFFTRTGTAVHGTFEQRHLGHAVSHGCVRLSVKNAATLWQLVKREKMANTTVEVSGTVADAPPEQAQAEAAARSKPLSLAAQTRGAAVPPRYRARYGAPVQYQPRYYYAAPPVVVYQPRYEERPPPFPFFIFGR
jgi:L,D-transpeptidase catalytic domain